MPSAPLHPGASLMAPVRSVCLLFIEVYLDLQCSSYGHVAVGQDQFGIGHSPQGNGGDRYVDVSS